MPSLKNCHSYKSTGSKNGSNGTGKGGGFGFVGWAIIVIVALLLICFLANGASWDAIDTLLGLGLLAFLFFIWLFR